MNCACGKMCKLLIMSEHDLLHGNFSVNCNHCHWIAVTLLASVIYLSSRPQVSMVYKLINHAGCW